MGHRSVQCELPCRLATAPWRRKEPRVEEVKFQVDGYFPWILLVVNGEFQVAVSSLECSTAKLRIFEKFVKKK